MGRIFFIDKYGNEPNIFTEFVYETLPDLFKCQNNNIKITEIFNNFLRENPIISNKGLFRKNITKKLNFPISGRNSLNYWKHRGWNDKSSLLKVVEVNQSNKLKADEKRVKNKIPTVFKFKTVVFELNSEPICVLCGSKLNYDTKLSGYNKKNIIGIIKSCDNIDCKTNDCNKLFKYENYLPKDVWEHKKNELSTSIKKSNMLCINYWLNKGLTENESKNKISEIQSKRGKLVKGKNTKITKEYLKNKGYSEEEIKETCLTPSQIKFWLNKGLTEDESKNKISELQKNASKKVDHTKFFKPNQVNYWLNKGCSEDEAKEKVSERQKTFSLEKCIKKYGEEEGKKIFTERQNNWQKSLNENGDLKKGFSKISQNLFNILLTYYDEKDKNKIMFAIHNGEFSLKKEDGGIWLYDFTDHTNKKIIEYNGDNYHANPKKYKGDDKPNPFRQNILAEEIWEKDYKKQQIAKNNGYDVLVIWDSEYRWGKKENVIKKCLDFLSH